VNPLRQALLAVPALLLFAIPAQAWPGEAMAAIGRDACRLLPASLSRLLADRERQVQLAAAQLAPDLTSALARDRVDGVLQPETLALVEREIDQVVLLLHERRVSEGLVRMGGLLRVTADLSDPVLAAGAEGWPPGLEREYYALFSANLPRMPVVLDDRKALSLSRPELGGLLQALAWRSREQAPTIRVELLRGGRVVSHQSLDFHSPAWAISSLAYSRAVTGTAAIWLVAWREVRGDQTRMRRAQEVAPRDAPPRPGAGIRAPVNDRSLQPEAP
jgi:hypothetical protein